MSEHEDCQSGVNFRFLDWLLLVLVWDSRRNNIPRVKATQEEHCKLCLGGDSLGGGIWNESMLEMENILAVNWNENEI